MHRVLFVRVFHNNALTESPPLGIGSIVSYIRERDPDFSFDIFDFCIHKNLNKFILEKYTDSKPLIIGISSLLRHIGLAIQTAQTLKRLLPDIPIVMGGAGPSVVKEKLLEEVGVDFVIYGEGEEGFYRLIKTLATGGNLVDVPSLIYKENGNNKINNPYVLTDDEIPSPDYEFINIEAYFKKSSLIMLGRQRSFWTVTTRGCPYSCIYCHGIFGKKVRYMPIKRVVDSFEKLNKRYHFSFVEIEDDIFNINEERAMEILANILKINNSVMMSYPNGLRMDIPSKKFLDFVGRNNTKHLSFAIESASKRIQRLIKKNLNLLALNENIRYLSRYPVSLRATFILGFPTETLNEMLQSIRFAFNLPVTYISFLRLVPNIGTEVFEMLPEEQKSKIWENLKCDIHYHNNYFNASNVPDYIINNLQRLSILGFYLRPTQLIKVLRETPADGLRYGLKLITDISLGKAKE